MVIQSSDSGRQRGQLQRRVVNVGGGDTGNLKKLGHEIRTISDDVEKLPAPANLFYGTLVPENPAGEVKTNLPYPGHQVFQRKNGSPYSSEDADHF